MSESIEKVKCLIVGSGPAGFTAAIYASRANMKPVLYQGMQPGGQLTTTTEVDNFPGYPKGVDGTQMMMDLEAQAKRFGADVRTGMITKVDFAGPVHKIWVDNKTEIHSDTIVISTGASARYLGLDSEQHYLANGGGVSACAVCDGFFYKGMDVVVVGGGDTAAEEATYLAKLCTKVTLLVRRDKMRASKAMQKRVFNTNNLEVLFNHETKSINGEPGEIGVEGVTAINNITGEEKYKLEQSTKDLNGTDIIIYLNEDNHEFAEEGRVKFLLEKYSQYINFPLNLISESGETNRINDSEALWLKPKRSIKDEEYVEFYKFITFDQDDPLLWAHNKVEGKNEYTNLLYIPSKPPFDLWNRESPRGVKLYIQRVFIMDDASHFLPLYLRFVRGIIDTSDLPLNVSREILQEHQLVETIKKGATKRVLDSLINLKKDSFDKYKDFWNEYGLVLKEGTAEDFENKELISSLLLFVLILLLHCLYYLYRFLV